MTDREMQKKIAELLGWTGLWCDSDIADLHGVLNGPEHIVPDWPNNPVACEMDLMPILIEQHGR